MSLCAQVSHCLLVCCGVCCYGNGAQSSSETGLQITGTVTHLPSLPGELLSQHCSRDHICSQEATKLKIRQMSPEQCFCLEILFFLSLLSFHCFSPLEHSPACQCQKTKKQKNPEHHARCSPNVSGSQRMAPGPGASTLLGNRLKIKCK